MSQQQRDGGTGNIILRPEGDAAESQEAAQEVSPANSAKTDHQETILRRSHSELDVTHKYYHTLSYPSSPTPVRCEAAFE